MWLCEVEQDLSGVILLCWNKLAKYEIVCLFAGCSNTLRLSAFAINIINNSWRSLCVPPQNV